MDERLLRHEQSVRAVGDHVLRCGPPVCAVGDHVLLESKKEHANNPLEPRQQQLVVKASRDAGF